MRISEELGENTANSDVFIDRQDQRMSSSCPSFDGTISALSADGEPSLISLKGGTWVTCVPLKRTPFADLDRLLRNRVENG